VSEKFRPHDDWKMHTYAPARGDYSACVYYRIEVPFMGLMKLGLAECFEDRGKHHHIPEIRDRRSIVSMLTSDINLFYAMEPESGEGLMESCKRMKTGTINGKLIYPPSLVYDIDDNLDWVHPFNNTYACYGVRTEAGDLLNPGDSVGTFLNDGRKIIMWQDGVTEGDKGFTFNIERNQAWNKKLHEFVRKCDAFTTPSKWLAKYHQETNGYPMTHVFPNSIIPEDWYYPNLVPRKKNIRVLWQGGGSHMSDWFALKPAMTYIAKKYPHVTFVIFGEVFNWITDAIPEKQLEIHPWVPYEAYKTKRAILDCDINICVLRDDEFSRSKSAIKFYEGALGPKPEATLAPDMPPYNEEIVDGETGLLYDPNKDQRLAAESFAANLEELIKNTELRKKVAAGGKAWVLENRHYLKTVPALYDFYQELRLRKMKECPYDPEADRLRAEANAAAMAAPQVKRVTRAKRKAVKARKAKK